MKTKKSDLLLTILFCGFLFVMLGLYLLLPKKAYSELEKDYLADAPELTMENIVSGEFDEQVEAYLADHVPGRSFFVGVNAYYDLYSGRQVTKPVYLAKGDRLLEAPYTADMGAISANMAKINAFAEKISQPVDLMLVPSAGYYLQDSIVGIHDPYQDDAIIEEIYAMAGESVQCRDLLTPFSKISDPASLYYRTDHHWTALGAYEAYCAYMTMLGKESVSREEFAVESHEGFLGSTCSRSGLWKIPAEPVELWKTDTAFAVDITENKTTTTYDSLFFMDKLQELDKYTVYLGGNHGIVTIRNPEAAGKGHLLVFRDSYANCLGTFLAHSYETVTLVDLRYCKDPRNPVSNMVLEGEYTDILICYSIGNFLTDENIVWLR